MSEFGEEVRPVRAHARDIVCHYLFHPPVAVVRSDGVSPSITATRWVNGE